MITVKVNRDIGFTVAHVGANGPRVYTAGAGAHWVTVGELGGSVVLIDASEALRAPGMRTEYLYFFSKAAAGMGWRRDRRCRQGWRKVTR